MTRTMEHFYEVLRIQLAAHIDYDTACAIADAHYAGDISKANEIVSSELVGEQVDLTNRIVERIRTVFADTLEQNPEVLHGHS